MAARLIACRIALVRRALFTASSAAERVPVLAAMIEVAGDLRPADLGGTGTARAKRLRYEAIAHLRAAAGELLPGGEDHCLTLFLLAQGLRDRDRTTGPVPDLDDAIGCLRQLAATLPPGSPDLPEAEFALADALLTRAGRPSGRLADADEAGALLTDVRASLAPGHPGFRLVTSVLAIQRALRYHAFGGPEADREDAERFAADCLTEPDTPDEADAQDEARASGHLVLAWMALTRGFAPEQRRSQQMHREMSEARYDAAAAAALLARYAEPGISRADAETAIAHLAQLPASVNAFSQAIASMLWALAQLAVLREGGSVTGTDRVAADLNVLAERAASEEERGEVLALRATLLAAEAQRGTWPEDPAAEAADALADAVAALPAGHVMRDPVLGLLTDVLSGAVGAVGSPVVVGAEDAGQGDYSPGDSSLGDALTDVLDLAVKLVDRMPHDDPSAVRALTVVGARVLGVAATDRTALGDERLAAGFDRLATGLAPGDPLVPLAEFMRWMLRYLHAAARRETSVAEGVLREMIRYATLVPAGHVARPFMLSGVAAAHLELHTLTGELRDLELAERAIEQALGEAESASAGPASAGSVAGLYAPGTAPHAQLLGLRGHALVRLSTYDPDPARLAKAIADLERAEAVLGQEADGMSGREQAVSVMAMTAALGTARTMLEELTRPSVPASGLGPAADAAFGRLLVEAEAASRNRPDYPVLAMQAAAGLMLRALSRHDVALVDRAIALLAGACAIPGLGLRQLPRVLQLHGSALHTRFAYFSGDPRDLAHAIDRLEEARRAVEQEPGSVFTGTVLCALASAYRTRGSAQLGDVDRAVRFGLSGLRERAADVLLQDSDDNALRVARQGTSDAIEMARWFLDRGRGAEAVSALEYGRGMVLHAATSEASVADTLTAAGYPGLATEWADRLARTAPRRPAPDGDLSLDQGPDDDLRHRAMLALAGTPQEALLLSPPPVADIGRALRTVGADALAYLLAADDTGPGIAVLVDASGRVSVLSLPRLKLGGDGPVARFVRARQAADVALSRASAPGPAASMGTAAMGTGEVRERWLAALTAVCDWAWSAATGPLLRAVPPLAEGRPRRIVLVPGAELGLVPWHAARRPDGGRYACQDAVFSYAATARQFTETAGRGGRPWPQAPVLISDADPSLYLTAACVAHLHEAHYPAGSVFGSARARLDPGVPGSASATRGDVLAAVSGPDTSGPSASSPGASGGGPSGTGAGAVLKGGARSASLVHFGCHGMVAVPALGSSLRLGTGPDGGELTVSIRDILHRARAAVGRPGTSRTGSARTGDALDGGETRRGGLVVLASCLTDVTETDYDEALTLASAFLAAGAAGVVAARWSVPDAATALFMSAFHAFLNNRYPDPARALREAQLWMLDPHREVPDGWSAVLRDEASLADQPDGPALAGLEAWAGFTYQGR